MTTGPTPAGAGSAAPAADPASADPQRADPARAGPARPRFVLGRLVERSDRAVLDEIRRVAALVEGPVFSLRRFRRLGRVSYATLRKRFGGWGPALARAGLGHRFGGPPAVTAKLRARPGQRMSDAALLAELRAAARPDGTVTAAEYERRSRGTWHLLRRRFGSWAAAVAAAGLSTGRSARRPSAQALDANLERLWLHYGRAPQRRECARPPSTVGPGAYIRRHGGWTRALADFARRMNGEAAGEVPGRAIEAATTAAAPPAIVAEAAAPRPEQCRSIPLALRYKVMQRDRFTCTACGISPAVVPMCRLHVDHHVAWSKGGASTADNLRTLCQWCNWGKGDRE